MKKKVNRPGKPTIPTHYTKWLRARMCLEDHRLKKACCNTEHFQVSRTESYSEVKCLLRVWEAIRSTEVAGSGR